MDVEQVLNRSEGQLMSIPGVVGVGITERGGRPVISIMVRALTPGARARLPEHIQGVPTVIEVVGDISAF